MEDAGFYFAPALLFIIKNMGQGRQKICYIIPEFDLATGTHFFHLYGFFEALAAKANLFVIAERGKNPNGHAPFEIHIQRFSWLPLRTMELFFLLIRVRLSGYRFFYTHYSFAGAFASWLVTKIFGGTNFYWNCGMPWLYERGRAEEALFRFALKHSVFVTGTPGLATMYRRQYRLKEKNMRVMPNWVDIERFGVKKSKSELKRHLNIGADSKVVLFVHRLSRRKGSDKIVPVAARVAKARPDVIFLIVGSGPEYDNLRLEIRNLKLENNIRLMGDVPNQEIQNYFAAADIFFMPSEEEGFPHVLLEAMAAGIPYVASDVGGVREITPNVLWDYLAPADDVELFSKNLITLLRKTPEEYNSIAGEERKWVRQYDSDAVRKKFMTLFVG